MRTCSTYKGAFCAPVLSFSLSLYVYINMCRSYSQYARITLFLGCTYLTIALIYTTNRSTSHVCSTLIYSSDMYSNACARIFCRVFPSTITSRPHSHCTGRGRTRGIYMHTSLKYKCIHRYHILRCKDTCIPLYTLCIRSIIQIYLRIHTYPLRSSYMLLCLYYMY